MKFFFGSLLIVLLVCNVKAHNVLLNSGFEDNPYNNHWKKAVLSGGGGEMYPSGVENAFNGKEACILKTTIQNDNFGKVGLKSNDYLTTGKVFTAKVMAKTDAEGVDAGLGFKIQIAAKTADGTTKYFASQEQKLSTNYTAFSFTKDASGLGLDFETVRVVLQCGGYLGNYYFDDVVLDAEYNIEGNDSIIPAEITPINGINTKHKVIAFTFDDGPNVELSKQIANLFEQNQGKATFFNVGENLNGNEEIVQAMLNAGHEIGNHTMTHARLPDYEKDQDIINEIVNFQELYELKFAYTPKLFRAPFLDYGQNATPNKDNRVGGVLKKYNLIPVNADVYTKDASLEQTSDAIIEKIKSNVNEGSIILCHEREHTLEAMQTVLPYLSSLGYTFVTVSELLRLEQGWKTIDPTNQKIQIRGSHYIKNVNNELIMHRHADDVYLNSTQENLFNPIKARTSSGIKLKFKTSSPKVNVRFRIVEGNESGSTFGIFQNNEFVEVQNFPYVADGEILVEINSIHENEAVEYDITFPIWTDVNLLGIELEYGYDLAEMQKKEMPVYVAYGNSITHGRGQNASFETYPYILAERFSWELFNIAVGGGKTSQVAADMLRDDFEKIDILTMLIGYNDYNGEGIDTITYRERYINFINSVRSKHVNTKFFCITLTTTTNIISEKSGIEANDFRQVVINIVNERRAKGDSNIFLVRGDELTTEADLNDPVHLNVKGARNFAEALFQEMKTTIGSETSANKKKAGDLRCYPNPTAGELVISGAIENSFVSICNSQGKILFRQKIHHNEQSISLRDVKPGLYFLNYWMDGKNRTKRIIVQK